MPKQLPKPDMPGEDSGSTQPSLTERWPEPIPSFTMRPPRDVSERPTEWLNQSPEPLGEPRERRIKFRGFAEQHGIEAERLRAELPALDNQIADLANIVTSWGLRLKALERQCVERSPSEQEDYERLVEVMPLQRGFYEELRQRRAQTVARIAYHRRTALSWLQRSESE